MGRAKGDAAREYRKANDARLEASRAYSEDNPEYFGLLEFDDAQDWLEELDSKGMMHPMGFPRDEFARDELEQSIVAREVPFNKSRPFAPSKAGKRRTMVEDWPLVLKAFGSACAYCGVKDKLQMEHVHPVSRGGQHTWQNVVPACASCNLRKRAKPLTDWLESMGATFFEAAIRRMADGQKRLVELRAKRAAMSSAV